MASKFASYSSQVIPNKAEFDLCSFNCKRPKFLSDSFPWCIFAVLKFQDASDEKCAYSGVMSDELVIAGVFLRLFIANPSWQVRHPKQFTTELIEKVLECMGQPTPELDIVTSAFVALLANHPSVADHVSL